MRVAFLLVKEHVRAGNCLSRDALATCAEHSHDTREILSRDLSPAASGLRLVHVQGWLH
jgi:hypothetical protein